MAWIQVTDEQDASGELQEAYRNAASRRGWVANILKIHSTHPRVLVRHLELYLELMFGASELTRAEREMIGVAVSTANHCHY